MAEDEQPPVARARAGEQAAWESLFQRYQLPVYVYVFELVHDEQTSLDIVQEAFVAAVRHIASLREDGKFGSWLFGIAHQKCIQRWRKHDRESAALEQITQRPQEFGGDPGELLIRCEDEAQFMKLLNQLPPAHCAVLLLHFIEDFSLDEIARITGANIGTVKSRMHYAKRALRKLWEEK
ncbi:MAG: RNA polymerase sigma factor [Limisphaerales bacterium]